MGPLELVFDGFELRQLVNCTRCVGEIERLFDANELPNEFGVIFLQQNTTQSHAHHL